MCNCKKKTETPQISPRVQIDEKIKNADDKLVKKILARLNSK